MKRLSVAVRMLAALSLALSMLAALAVTTSAAPNPSGGFEAEWDGDSIPPLFGATPSDDFCAVFGCVFKDGAFDDGAQEVYFPAVGNADESTGLGAAQTSITVQNLSVDDAYIFIYVGEPEDDDGIDLDNWDVVEYAYLSGGASKTFQGSDLEIPSGEVRPVVVAGYNYVVMSEGDGGSFLELGPVILAGVAKQAVTGDSLPYTTAADTSVSGYNAIGGRELGYFDQLYFPIVQTNCGPGGCWNSILRIANMGLDDNAAVTVRFFPADDGSGSLQTGFQLQGLVDVGEVWSIDLSEWVPEGWVGSAHVYTDDAVGAIVDRVKVGTDMWITNTASNANYAEVDIPSAGTNAEVSASYPYVLFAPDVRTDYNGWNTGINVANTVDYDTDVSIQYFGSNGNAPAAQTRRLAAHGMTYFYNPSDPSEDRCDQPATDVPGCEFIGGAIILSSNPVAVAVDGVKYFGNDANVGQAFSYSATGNAYDVLAAALIQKGNPANGMGATSGINFMNANASATVVEATWLNPSGFGASNFGSSIVWVPGFATGFVYTMFHNNLPNGYVGSAIVTSELPIVATTANVDYQVNGDGTAIWNLSNPCGFFRQAGECVYESPLEPLDANATLTKEVVVDNPFDDVEGTEALEGVMVSYDGIDDNGFAVSGTGFTGATGMVTFAVPGGIYDITLDVDAPEGFVYTGDLMDIGVVVDANGAMTVTNTLTLAIAEGDGTLTKMIVNLPEEYVSLESAVYFCDASITDLVTCAANAVVTGGYGEDGQAQDMVSADVAAGAYTICTAVVVTIDIGGGMTEDIISGGCENTYDATPDDGVEDVDMIIVLDGSDVVVINDFDATTTGTLDVNVRDDEMDAPIVGAEVCVYPFGDLTLTPLCDTTDVNGDVEFMAPAGNHTVNVMAVGYEQESSVAMYSPAADVADGGDDDMGLAADVVVALDPITGILDVDVTLQGQAIVDGTIVSVFVADGGDSATACAGAPVTSGATVSGSLSTGVAPGTYCVQATVLIATTPTVTAQATVVVGDPAGDVDATLAFVVNP